MKIFGSLLKRSAQSFEAVISRLDGLTGSSVGGVTVSTARALEVATVLACAKVIADGCGVPALKVFRQNKDDTRELALNERIYHVLNRRPNQWQTSIEFRRQLTMHALLTGNGLAIKNVVGGQVRELIPVAPQNYEIREVGRYEYRFRVWDQWGHIGDFTPEQVFHLPNHQWDLLQGMNAVRLARSAIGLSIGAESYQADLVENGGRPAGLLSSETSLNPDALARVKQSWQAFSTNKRGGTAVLDQGFKYTPLSMNSVDAQHLETRRFQIEEVCRAFAVFPIMVGHSDKTATFASSESFFSAHVRHTLAPWHELWKQRLDRSVLDGEGPLFAHFDTRYLLQGSLVDRAAFSRTMVETGIMTRNEIRREEGLDPLEGLDDPLTPLNMGGGDGSAQDADSRDSSGDRGTEPAAAPLPSPAGT